MQGEKKSREYRFNIFDVILIVIFMAVIVSVAMLVIRSLPDDGTLTGNVRVSYVISVNDIPEEVGDEVAVGQKVYDASTGEIIGTVSSVIVNGHIIKGVNQETGENIANTVPGRCDLNVTVEAAAKYDGNRYEINGKRIACGEMFEFRTSTASLSGICISMNDR
ncbi:MAG: DUF4330 domain-containing protein [Clostridia bacterium]|nr:DUF4330 domain-containing protein [Clostridia bacterium]